MLGMGGLAFWGFGKMKGFAGCGFAFGDVQKALLRYADSHGGHLPNAATWQDDIRNDYNAVKTPKAKLGPFPEMSAQGDWGCADEKGAMSGMAFNSDLSGKKIADITDPAGTIMVFEVSSPAKNLNKPYKPGAFLESPLIFGTHRGWMEAPVQGTPGLLQANGTRAPFKTDQGGGNGVSFQAN